jgi:hypothetical protein
MAGRNRYGETMGIEGWPGPTIVPPEIPAVIAAMGISKANYLDS